MKPIDIEMKEFKRARIGGYNVNDVNEFLDEVIRAFEDILRENTDLENKIASLNETLNYYKSMETTLTNTMILAEKTSEDTRSLAHEKADQIIAEGTLKAERMVEKARQEVYTLNQSIDDLKKQYNSAKIQIKQLLQGQLEIIDSQKIYTKELTTISTDTPSKEMPQEEDYYTREYQIINEEDVM